MQRHAPKGFGISQQLSMSTKLHFFSLAYPTSTDFFVKCPYYFSYRNNIYSRMKLFLQIQCSMGGVTALHNDSRKHLRGTFLIKVCI